MILRQNIHIGICNGAAMKPLGRVMSKNALNKIDADYNKQHKVSPRLSRKLHHYFWQEIPTMKVIKTSVLLTLLLKET